MNKLNEIFQIFWRELKKFYKDQNLFMIFLFAPLAYPLMYGAIYLNKIENNVPIGVYDLDNSSASRDLVRMIDAHQNVSVAEVIRDEAQMKDAMAHERCQAVLFIPNDFSKNLKSGKQSHIQLMLTPGRLLVMSEVAFPISQLANDFGKSLTKEYIGKHGVPISQNYDYAAPVKLDMHYLYNPYLTYGDLILPGLMIIIISQIVVIGAAAATAKEWGLDKWADLFSVSRNPLVITIGKLTAYFLNFIILACIRYTFIAPLYNINYLGQAWDMFRVAILGILACASFGMFIGTFFKHRISVFVVLGFTTYPFFMMSGFAWPEAQIPTVINNISHIFPLVPFIKATFRIGQMAAPIQSVTYYMWNLVCLIFVYSGLFCIRTLGFRKGKNRVSRLGKYLEEMPR